MDKQDPLSISPNFRRTNQVTLTLAKATVNSKLVVNVALPKGPRY